MPQHDPLQCNLLSFFFVCFSTYKRNNILYNDGNYNQMTLSLGYV